MFKAVSFFAMALPVLLGLYAATYIGFSEVVDGTYSGPWRQRWYASSSAACMFWPAACVEELVTGQEVRALWEDDPRWRLEPHEVDCHRAD